VQVLRAVGTGVLDDSPEGYLYRVAFNLNRRRFRRLRPRAHRPDGDYAHELLLEVEARTDLLDEVARLPRQQREALLLVGWVGLSSEDAGRVLGISPQAIRARVHRARSALKEGGGNDG
jgi:RNA polymerase sigma-70 factor (ECF subfamily)